MNLPEAVTVDELINGAEIRHPSPALQISSNRLVASKVESHQASLEWLRLVSCIGIVWFHCQAPGALVGYAGLPALIALSVALASVPGKSIPFGAIVKKRAKRLLLPWAFWCLVYALWRIVGAVALKAPLGGEFQEWMLFTGPAIHLWYLPFAFVATCFASVLNSGRSSARRADMIFWSAFAALAFVLCSLMMSRLSLPRPLAQWTFGLPAIFIGLALPQFMEQRRRILGILCVALMVTLVGIVAWSLGLRELLAPYLVGTFGLAAAWGLRGAASPHVLWIGSLSYGIYLAHPLFASLIGRALGTQTGPTFAILVIVVTVAFVAVARRTLLRAVM